MPAMSCLDPEPTTGPRAGDEILAALCERTLVVAPHADDEAFLAGTLARVRGLGCSVRVAVAAVGTHYHPHAGRVVGTDERLDELRAAAAVAGLELAPVGFPGHDGLMDTVPLARVIGWVEDAVREFRPTAVLVPLPSHHQDHRVVYEAAIAALRPAPDSPVRLVALYEYPPAAVHAGPYPVGPLGRLVVDVSGGPMAAKREVLARYRSQLANRPANHPLHPDAVEKLAAVRGLEAGVDFAETLYPLRIVL